MIFDIPASIGSKRKYLVLNGVDVVPFTFPTPSNPSYYMSFPNPFVVSRSEVPNVITLRSKINGNASDYDEAYQGLCKIDLKTYFKNANENIKDYRKLCFVVSFKNYDEDWWDGNDYTIATATNVHTTSMTYYDVERKSLRRIDDGNKEIYQFNLERFYDLDEMYVRFHRGTRVVTYGDEDSQLYIHDIYLE